MTVTTRQSLVRVLAHYAERMLFISARGSESQWRKAAL